MSSSSVFQKVLKMTDTLDCNPNKVPVSVAAIVNVLGGDEASPDMPWKYSRQAIGCYLQSYSRRNYYYYSEVGW
jgi:hypothetical protein